MAADPVLDQICQFFGGPYVPLQHAYQTPTVAGIAQVRRGFDKLDDYAEYFLGMPPGTLTGCQTVIRFTDGVDVRKTFPAVTGRKHHTYRVAMYCYFWSTAPYAEDCQDQVSTVRRAVISKMRTDPTCGSGGIEAGFFHVGIPDDHGQGGEIDWAETNAVTVDQATKQGLTIRFEAHELPVG
jgi:hypothetical protein